MTIFPDSVSRNPQFPGDASKGDALELGTPDSLPESPLPGCSHPVCGSDGFPAVFGRNVEIPTDCHGSQGRRLLQLGRAETVLAHQPDGPTQFGLGSQSSLAGRESSLAVRRFLVGDHLPAVLDHQPAVCMFQDLHPETCMAGIFLVKGQLQGAPLVVDCVVPGHRTGGLDAEDPLQR